MRFVLFSVLVGLTQVRGGAHADGRSSGPAYLLIVNADNPTTAVDRRFVVDCFLKRATRWYHDEAIHPVDLEPDSPTRRRFSEEVLSRSVAAVKSYWQQMIFSGHGVPPPELDRDDQVVEFVRRNNGALGYVSPTATLVGVKIISVR